MAELRIPPQNVEAERAVIGSLLIDDQVIHNVVDILSSECFYDPKHEIIFESILNLFGSNKAIDLLTLTSDLKKNKKFKQAGGASYLADIVAGVPTSANVVEYANLVKDAFIRRQLIREGAKLDELARQEDKKLDDILDELESDVLGFSTNTSKREYYDAKTLLEMQIEKADEYAKHPDGMRGLPTGLKSLDKILGGLHKSDLIIVAARPGVGKSAIATDVVRHVTIPVKKTALIFSLEMPAVQVIERIMAGESSINLWKLRMSQLDDKEYRRHSEAMGRIAESKLFIDDTSGLSIAQLRSKSRRVMLEHGLDLIVIDYLQLMQGSSRSSDNRAQEVGEISRSLKILARELNIPIIALSQLNRAVENRIERVPQLSDLRESGSIEQDADLVIFLSRDEDIEEVNENNLDREIGVTISIAKHRNGPVGKIKVRFKPGHMKFLEYDGPTQD